MTARRATLPAALAVLLLATGCGSGQAGSKISSALSGASLPTTPSVPTIPSVGVSVPGAGGGGGSTTTPSLPSTANPGATVTVTEPASTVTIPASTVTVPASTVTTPGKTVTTPGSTVTIPASTVVSTVTQPTTTSGGSSVPGWAWTLLGALLVGLGVAAYALWKSRHPDDAPPDAGP